MIKSLLENRYRGWKSNCNRIDFVIKRIIIKNSINYLEILGNIKINLNWNRNKSNYSINELKSYKNKIITMIKYSTLKELSGSSIKYSIKSVYTKNNSNKIKTDWIKSMI